MADATKIVARFIAPWRKQHTRAIAHLEKLDKQYQIAKTRVNSVNARGKASPTKAQKGKDLAEANKALAKIERQLVENEKLRKRIMESKARLIHKIISQISPLASPEDRATLYNQLLPTIDKLITSGIELKPLKLDPLPG
jgi:hypothetical protein